MIHDITLAIGFIFIIGSLVHIQKRLDIIVKRFDTMDEMFMSPKQIFDKYDNKDRDTTDI